MSKTMEAVDLIGKIIITKDKKRYTITGYITNGDFVVVDSKNNKVLISPKDVEDIVEPKEVPTDLEMLYLGYTDGEW